MASYGDATAHAAHAKKLYTVSLLHDKSLVLYNPRFGRLLSAPPPRMDDVHSKIYTTSLLATSGSCVYVEQTFLDKDLAVENDMIYCFDTTVWGWRSHSMPARQSKTIHTLGMCSASHGDHIYVAGGAQRTASWTRFRRVKSVDRMDVRTLQWESLPDMKHRRDDSSMVVLRGRICVIGGHVDGDSKEGNSGEVWDPKTGGEWTLVPELWPIEVFKERRRPKVAVVMETLYAIKDKSSEVMRFEYDAKLWRCVGRLPALDSLCASCCPWSCREVLAVGQELWVILIRLCPDKYAEHKSVVFVTCTCLPTSQPLAWNVFPDVTDGKAMCTSTIELNV